MNKLTASQVASITVQDILARLTTFTREERSLINSEIIAIGDEEDRAKRDEFKYGDKVKFKVDKRPYYGQTITGTIVKRNVKTIEVKPDGGGRNWKVSASLLSKA